MSELPPRSIGDEILEGLTAFNDALAAGTPISERFRVRQVRLKLNAEPFDADRVKRLRRSLHAPRSVFARFLGVGLKTVRAWERGARPVSPIAVRFMQELETHPEIWTNRFWTVETEGV